MKDKTTVSGEVDCGKAMKGCVASFPMLLFMVDEKTSIYDSILNVALSTKDASTHDRSERREALLFGCRTLPPLLNAAKVCNLLLCLSTVQPFPLIFDESCNTLTKSTMYLDYLMFVLSCFPYFLQNNNLTSLLDAGSLPRA